MEGEEASLCLTSSVSSFNLVFHFKQCPVPLDGSSSIIPVLLSLGI